MTDELYPEEPPEDDHAPHDNEARAVGVTLIIAALIVAAWCALRLFHA